MYARQCTRKLFNHPYISVIVLVVVVVMINESDACPRRSPPARVPPPQRKRTTPRPHTKSPPKKTNPTGETIDYPICVCTHILFFSINVMERSSIDCPSISFN